MFINVDGNVLLGRYNQWYTTLPMTNHVNIAEVKNLSLTVAGAEAHCNDR